MKISAIICELNPLHSGHQALFAHAQSHFDGLVCVLSGNYVQRGEPAVLDKWTRTRLALESGADLVLELPLPWAMAGAERFAAGGVFLIRALGGVDTLLFGGETEDIAPLWELAKALLSPAFSALLRQGGDTGNSFAIRRQRAVAQLVGEETASLLEKPNCILGVEYLKAILSQGAALKAQVFPRLGSGHDRPDPAGPVLSASQARELLRGNAGQDRLPAETAAVWRTERALGRCPASLEKLETAVLCRLRSMEAEELAALPDVSEGLEFRLRKAARQAGSLEEFYTLVKSKRISHARVRRLALSAFLGLTKNLPPLPPALRVLGMTPTGREILRQARPSLPLALRAGDFQRLGGEALSLFQLEARADDLYALALPSPAPCGRDYTEGLVKIGF